MTWDEMDVAGRVWTVLALRMKAKREHRVPLCRRAVAILDAARTLGDGTPLVFPMRSGKAIPPLGRTRIRVPLLIARQRWVGAGSVLRGSGIRETMRGLSSGSRLNPDGLSRDIGCESRSGGALEGVHDRKVVRRHARRAPPRVRARQPHGLACCGGLGPSRSPSIENPTAPGPPSNNDVVHPFGGLCLTRHAGRARLVTADRRPQTADRRPQTADRRPQTADRRPRYRSSPGGRTALQDGGGNYLAACQHGNPVERRPESECGLQIYLDHCPWPRNRASLIQHL